MPTATDSTNRTCDATLLLDQIGRFTLISVGARNAIDLGHGLRLKVGRANRWLEVTLNGLDLFDVRIIRAKRGTCEVIEMGALTNVHVEELREAILHLADEHLC